MNNNTWHLGNVRLTIYGRKKAVLKILKDREKVIKEKNIKNIKKKIDNF